MIFRLRDEDDMPVMILDDEGIDWLRQGLDQLENEELVEVKSPYVADDGMGYFTIRKHDPETE